MAAPKNWGYTREQPFSDEILVSWVDGDLIKILDKEIVERLLTNADDRALLAAYARACYDSSTPTKKGERDWLLDPPRGLIQTCQALGHD
jgi:hypothetical protein